MADEVNEQPKTAPKRRSADHGPVKKFFGVCAFVVLGFYALTGAGVGVLAWRLNQGPWDAKVALPVIDALLSKGKRLNFDVGQLTVTRNPSGQGLALEMHNVSVSGPHGEFLTIGRADMGLSLRHLLLATFHFSNAEVQDLSIRFVRLPDGNITLTGAEKNQGADKAVSETLRLDHLVNDLPFIDKLIMSDMRVVFEDQKDALIRRFDDVNIEINQERSLEGRIVTGNMTATLSGISDGSLTKIGFAYDPENETLSSSVELDNTDTRQLLGGFLRAANLPIIDMTVQGRADVRLKNDLTLDSLSLRLHGDDGMLYWPRSYGQGLENQKLTKFDLNIGYDPQSQTLQLLNAGITLKGITLEAKGTLTTDATWSKLNGELLLSIPVLAVDALPAVWPKIWDTSGREWLVDRMDKGRFSHIAVNVPLTAKRETTVPDEDDIEVALDTPESDLEPETRWNFETGTVKGTFDFTGVTVDYRHPLLPARNTTGKGVYEGLSLTLDIESSDIGDLHVNDGSLYFDDLITPGTGEAKLHFNMSGSVKSVFDYLEKEPIAYRKKVALDASQAKGRADVDVSVEFPTHHAMTTEDVHVLANAKLHDLVVPGAVKGLTLAGGPFDLEASENHFKLSGSGTLDGQPATISWAEMFAPKPTDAFASNLEAKIQTDKNIRTKFIGALESRVDGIIPADIAMITKPNGVASLDVSANLTNASIDFTHPFSAIKEKGQAANLKLKGTLQDGFIKSIDNLSVSGAGMTIASGALTFGRDKNNEPTLSKATLKGLKLGKNDADVEATWKSENDLTATVNGKSFDARNIMGKGDGTGSSSMTGYDVKLKLDQLWLGTIPLENATGSFVGNTNGTITMASLDAAAAGTPVTLRYSATGQEGDRLTLTADDAGKGLSALGINDRVRGGTLRIQGNPMKDGNPGDMKGKLVLKKFSVAKAPVLAKLINLLSLPGILNILNQDTGLSFERAEAEMTWLNRPGGALVSFKDGRTSGSSLGLTFEGDIDMKTDTINMQGTAIPMSEVNSLVSKIPLVGDILTGGAKGSGIFAATYSVKGPAADPEVTINPLSVLTPGILRRILFEGALTGGSK